MSLSGNPDYTALDNIKKRVQYLSTIGADRMKGQTKPAGEHALQRYDKSGETL
jgi:hypothetical protein